MTRNNAVRLGNIIDAFVQDQPPYRPHLRDRLREFGVTDEQIIELTERRDALYALDNQLSANIRPRRRA